VIGGQIGVGLCVLDAVVPKAERFPRTGYGKHVGRKRCHPHRAMVMLAGDA
jgi:hypothetical protein